MPGGAGIVPLGFAPQGQQLEVVGDLVVKSANEELALERRDAAGRRKRLAHGHDAKLEVDREARGAALVRDVVARGGVAAEFALLDLLKNVEGEGAIGLAFVGLFIFRALGLVWLDAPAFAWARHPLDAPLQTHIYFFGIQLFLQTRQVFFNKCIHLLIRFGHLARIDQAVVGRDPVALDAGGGAKVGDALVTGAGKRRGEVGVKVNPGGPRLLYDSFYDFQIVAGRLIASESRAPYSN